MASFVTVIDACFVTMVGSKMIHFSTFNVVTLHFQWKKKKSYKANAKIFTNKNY